MSKKRVALFPYMEEDKFGYIDVKGQLVVSAQYDETYPFVEGMGIVRVKDRYGYVDYTGELVIPIVWSSAKDFSCGLAFVIRGSGKGSWSGYIDRYGNEMFKASFDPYRNGFSEGLLPVSTYDGKWGVVDTSGKLVVPCQFDHIRGDFLDGMVVAAVDDASGVIDRQGQWLIKPVYSELRFLGEGRFLYKRGEEKGLMTFDGKEFPRPDLFYVGHFRGGYSVSALSDRCSYLIDCNGDVVFDPRTLGEKATVPEWFSEDLIGIETSDELIFLNREFKEQFRLAGVSLESEFANGLARVRFNQAPGGWGYVNRSGEIVWSCSGFYEFRTAELVELESGLYRWFPLVERWEDLSEGQRLMNPRDRWSSRKHIRNDLVVKADQEGLLKLAWWFKKMAYTSVVGDSINPSVGPVYDSPELLVELIDEFYTAMEDLED